MFLYSIITIKPQIKVNIHFVSMFMVNTYIFSFVLNIQVKLSVNTLNPDFNSFLIWNTRFPKMVQIMKVHYHNQINDIKSYVR